MNSAANIAHHPALWLRALLSSRRISRSASTAPATATHEPARIRRRPDDGDALVMRAVGAGVLQTRWA
jgi:hypothetical protein